jgi:hypothetical protein
MSDHSVDGVLVKDVPVRAVPPPVSCELSPPPEKPGGGEQELTQRG